MSGLCVFLCALVPNEAPERILKRLEAGHFHSRSSSTEAGEISDTC